MMASSQSLQLGLAPEAIPLKDCASALINKEEGYASKKLAGQTHQNW